MTGPASHPAAEPGRFHGLPPVPLAPDFAAWRSATIAAGLQPVVAIAGLRGKTSVLRLLDAIFQRAGIVTATWSTSAVEIAGKPQRGEIGPWRQALDAIERGDVGVGIQELDWATVHAAGLPAGSYPIVVLTNICGNDNACLIHREAILARKALPRVMQAVSRAGALVINAEDHLLVDATHAMPEQPAVLFGISRLTPLLRLHLAGGGVGAWRDGEVLRLGDRTAAESIAHLPGLAYALDGDATFQIGNILAAIAIARHCGIPTATIDAALHDFSPPAHRMAGTFTLVQWRGARIIIDRSDPSWFIRPVMRAIRQHGHGSLYVTTGRMDRVPFDDLEEVGRMLGRDAAAIVIHTIDERDDRAATLKRGAARNVNPTIAFHAATEGRAIAAAMKRLRPHDTLMILADDPVRAVRTVERLMQDTAEREDLDERAIP